MKAKFDTVVQQLRDVGRLESLCSLWNNAEDTDKVLKLSTGAIANGLSQFDTARMDKLLEKSKVDPWSYDAMKFGAVELQQMHSLLSEQTATWSAGFMSGKIISGYILKLILRMK
jgi:hypothetical protein